MDSDGSREKREKRERDRRKEEEVESRREKKFPLDLLNQLSLSPSLQSIYSTPISPLQRRLELLVRLVDALAGVAVEQPAGGDAESC